MSPQQLTRVDVLTDDMVLAAADRLVGAFAAHDTETYFGCFATDATFIFHPEAERLESRAAYEALWADWSREGWRVEDCTSTERRIQVVGETAIFTHTVHTVTSTDGTRSETFERETIVFARDNAGRMLAVHEHLSPHPAQSAQS